MDKKVFGYLLITGRSIGNYDVIAKNYWSNTVAMNRENNKKKTWYSCCVVCLNISWWLRKELAVKTGIPMEKIINISSLQDNSGFLSLNELIWVDAMMYDDFWGRMKVFDTAENISPWEIVANVDVCYEY